MSAFAVAKGVAVPTDDFGCGHPMQEHCLQAAKLIWGAFAWGDAKEGHAYWYQVATRLEQLGGIGGKQ